MWDKTLRMLLKNYNNRLIDELVMKHELETGYKITNTMITQQILPLIRQNLKSKTKKYKDLSKEVKNRTLNTAGKVLSKRIFNNVEAVNYILKNTSIQITRYQQLINRLQNFNRYSALKKSSEEGISLKGTPYSYRQIETVTKGVQKYENNNLQYEEAIHDYNYNRNTPILKTWNWSQLENTRHEELDGETVGLFELFTVVNSQNGDVDYLRFPGDLESDVNNCSNICNCECSMTTNREDGE